MSVLYVASAALAALACGYAVYLNLARAPMIADTARRLSLPDSMMVPCGALLGLAGVGLLAGLMVPALGTAAAIGLVAYFTIALAVHLRARDFHVTWALIFLALAVAALVTGLADHGVGA